MFDTEYTLPEVQQLLVAQEAQACLGTPAKKNKKKTPANLTNKQSSHDF